MTRGRWGPPAGRGRRGCYYCRRDMRPADFPAVRSLSGPGGGRLCRLRRGSGSAPGPCSASSGTRLARSSPFFVDASARSSRSFTVLSILRRRWRSSRSTRTRALRTSRSRRLRAVTPRRSKRRSCAWVFVRRGVRGDRVVHARDDAVAGDQRGADGDQHRALGVVAEHVRRLARRGLRLRDGRLGLVGRAGARALGVRLLSPGSCRGCSHAVVPVVVRFADVDFRDEAALRACRARLLSFFGAVGTVGIWEMAPVSSSPVARSGDLRTPVCNPPMRKIVTPRS